MYIRLARAPFQVTVATIFYEVSEKAEKQWQTFLITTVVMLLSVLSLSSTTAIPSLPCSLRNEEHWDSSCEVALVLSGDKLPASCPALDKIAAMSSLPKPYFTEPSLDTEVSHPAWARADCWISSTCRARVDHLRQVNNLS